MPIKTTVRGKARPELVKAIEEWAAAVTGKDGEVVVSRTKVLWRPTSNEVISGETVTAASEVRLH